MTCVQYRYDTPRNPSGTCPPSRGRMPETLSTLDSLAYAACVYLEGAV